MLSNMASSLILNKRISTTVAKAKALRKYVEPLLTKAKDDTTHSRRVVFSYLQDKYSVKILFDEVAEKIASRPGGYTRIIKTGARLGDNAEMCIMELVDYNELLLADAKPAKTKKRSRRGGKSKQSADKAAPVVAAAEDVVEVVEEATEVVEDAVTEVEEKVEEAVEETTAEAEEAKAEVEEVVEATKEVVAETEETATEETDQEDKSDEKDDSDEEKDEK